MTLAYMRVLLGAVWAASCCITAIRVGDEPERRIAILMVTFWLATTVAQFLTGDIYGTAIFAHVAFGAGLLWFATRYHKPWIWIMTALAAVLFVMHALLFQPSRPPSLFHLIATDVIVWGGPLFLAVVALRNWRRRKSLRTAESGAA